MNIKELADVLDGFEYPLNIPEDILQLAVSNRLVIVFGASDDLMEFRGAIDDELGAYEGRTAHLDHIGLIVNVCDNDDCPYYNQRILNATTIMALWDNKPAGYSWVFETSIPHETFDVLEDGERYCKGIVFSLTDIP